MRLIWITYLPWLVLLIGFLSIPAYAETNCSKLDLPNCKAITERLDILIEQQKDTNKLLEIQIAQTEHLSDLLYLSNKLLYTINQLLYSIAQTLGVGNNHNV